MEDSVVELTMTLRQMGYNEAYIFAIRDVSFGIQGIFSANQCILGALPEQASAPLSVPRSRHSPRR